MADTGHAAGQSYSEVLTREAQNTYPVNFYSDGEFSCQWIDTVSSTGKSCTRRVFKQSGKRISAADVDRIHAERAEKYGAGITTPAAPSLLARAEAAEERVRVLEGLLAKVADEDSYDRCNWIDEVEAALAATGVQHG